MGFFWRARARSLCGGTPCRRGSRPESTPSLFSVPLRSGTALHAALGANTTLVSLSLCHTELGVGAIEALAASLRLNATLRTINLGSAGVVPEEMWLVFSALAGSPESPSLCAITSLDCSDCSDCPLFPEARAALAESLARGAPLEELEMAGCMGDNGVALIAEGIAAAGPASRLRLLDLSGNGLRLKGAIDSPCWDPNEQLLPLPHQHLRRSRCCCCPALSPACAALQARRRWGECSGCPRAR